MDEKKAFMVRVSGYKSYFWFDFIQNVEWFMELCGEDGLPSWAFKRNELGQYERYACYVMDADGGYIIKRWED